MTSVPMFDHLRQIIDYGYARRGTKPPKGPFVQEVFDRSGGQAAHFACVFLVNWLVSNSVSGREVERLEPRNPATRAMREMVAASPELSALFVVADNELRFAPHVGPELRKQVHDLVPRDWYRDADV